MNRNKPDDLGVSIDGRLYKPLIGEKPCAPHVAEPAH